jgi:iron complex outermembrane receptor protein
MKFTTDYLGRLGPLSLGVLATLALSLPAATVQAQATDEEQADDQALEEIVVTGSRIKRDSTFTSTSPLAVINASEQVQFGAIDAASLLRTATSVAGQQVDSSFSGFTVDGGPGAETLALRGLGPERTLVLIDGRRIGAAGNFGAAVFPDLALIPTFLVERAEILLSGASSIYGADAVAGVVNIITPKNFEGIQLDVTASFPEANVGEEQLASIQFGASSDQARFFIGGEYFDREGVRARDREFTEGGDRSITIDEDGQRVEAPNGFFDQTLAFGPDCTFAGWTPGEQGGGSTIPNFSCDVDFGAPPYDNAFAFLDQHIWSPNTRWSAFASIEYDLESFGDSTIYAQVLNSNRKQAAHGGDAQFFPLVPAINTFNPFGTDVVPVAYDQDTRSDVDTTAVTYNRYLLGIGGNVPFLNGLGPLDRWTYDVSIGYTRSEGANEFDIARNDRLANSFNNCPNDAQDLFGGFSPECVVVDLFGPAFLENGSFGDAQDYLVQRVKNTTKVSQTAFEAGITGDLFELPAGPVAAFFGTAYREDSIFSDVDKNLEENNAWGRSAEGDTIGTTDITEFYTEFDVPILSGMFLAEELAVNLSYRVSDDKFFGTEDTWRVTANWDITDWVRLRGTAGTSFRAPNLKELFVADQTGFTNAFIDPCIAPPPEDDDRSQTIIDNCISEGVDPFTLGSDGAPSVPTVSGGADDLRPETSDSWTVGAVFSQPWTDRFDFQLSVDYTSIEIKDAVAEPSAGFILNQCYTSVGFSDPLCGRVTRNLAAAPDQRFLLEVDESVANIEIENYEDLSFSTLFVMDFNLGNASTTFSWNVDVTQAIELVNGLFVETADELVGSLGVPEWRVQSLLGFDIGNWRVSHRLNYFSETEDTEQQRANAGLDDDEVAFIGDFMSHAFSVSYNADSWGAFLTIENAFDEIPDLIHDDAFVGNSINNMPIGVYPSDAIMGRAIIFSVTAGF